MLPFGSRQAPLYRGSRQNRLKGNPQTCVSYPEEERAHTRQDQRRLRRDPRALAARNHLYESGRGAIGLAKTADSEGVCRGRGRNRLSAIHRHHDRQGLSGCVWVCLPRRRWPNGNAEGGDSPKPGVQQLTESRTLGMVLLWGARGVAFL